jgi:hypothetical protein
VGLDATVLEDRTLYSATPLDPVDLDANEDGPHNHVHLADLFGLDDAGGQVQYRLLNNTDPALFSAVAIDGQNDLVLQYAPDQHGLAHLTLQASDLAGNTEQLTLNVKLAAVNDTPTMRNLQNFTVTDRAAGVTIIDLFAAFDDKEDSDQELTFKIAGNTNPSLFSSSQIDLNRGLLILQHAAGRSGSAQLTITATDTGGLTIGMDTPPEFSVFNQIGGMLGNDGDEARAIGLTDMTLFTHWYFFEYNNGVYDYSSLDVAKFTRYLTSYTGDPSVPLVFDIENSEYVNTPEGRDRFAEVFELANQLRPDLDIGLYRYMPERSYHFPVPWILAQRHEAAGIDTWYTANADRSEVNYEAWLARNDLYRTVPVSGQYGGQPLADMVNSMHPSLYTFYRNVNAEPYWRPAALNAATDRFTVDGPSFDTVDVVRIEQKVSSTRNLGVSGSTDYYVVNVQGDTFQLSRTPDGAPIDFSLNSSGELFIGAKGPTWENMWHDPSVHNWKIYAEENIAEARKYGKPVYAWISPSMAGAGVELLEQDFVRWQLEVLRPLVDGIVIYEITGKTAEQHVQEGWWSAVSDFMATLEQPAGTVSVSISGSATTPNHLPVARNDAFSFGEDQSLNLELASLLTNDTDADGDQLHVVMGSGPSHGTLTQQANGSFVYRPDANFHGVDQFTYRVNDGTGLSAQPATVTLNVSSINDRPQAVADHLATAHDAPLNIRQQDLLANDQDIDGDPLAVQIVNGPQHGQLVDLGNGSHRYVPNAGYGGSDSFTYQVSDGNLVSLATTVTIDVAASQIPLQAIADAFATAEDRPLVLKPGQLLANDHASSTADLQVHLVDSPLHGRVRWRSDGSIVYVPAKNYHGLDRFNYRISDSDETSDVVAVQIHVKSHNDRPIGRSDLYHMVAGSTLRVRNDSVLDNDVDRDGDHLRSVVLRRPEHGRVTLKRDGTFVYRPEAGFSGIDSFQYRVVDEHGAASFARAVIRVARVNPLLDGPRLFAALPHHVARPPVPGDSGGGLIPSDDSLDGVTDPSLPTDDDDTLQPSGAQLSESNPYARALQLMGLLGG